jgi:hypothetical protein
MITTKQMAALLGIKPSRVRQRAIKLVEKREIPTSRKVGRDWIFEQSDISLFKQDGRKRR